MLIITLMFITVVDAIIGLNSQFLWKYARRQPLFLLPACLCAVVHWCLLTCLPAFACRCNCLKYPCSTPHLIKTDSMPYIQLVFVLIYVDLLINNFLADEGYQTSLLCNWTSCTWKCISSDDAVLCHDSWRVGVVIIIMVIIDVWLVLFWLLPMSVSFS